MKEHLRALDAANAFNTSRRYDGLAVNHIPFADLGARRDVDATLLAAIRRGEGLIAVLGRVGAGKSSVIAYTCDQLDDGFVPLRVPMAGVAADDPVAVARHATYEIAQMADLGAHERRKLAEAAATEATSEQRREIRGGLEVRLNTPVLTTALSGQVTTTAARVLETTPSPGEALAGLQLVYDAFWKLGRCPVVIVEDTDHWATTPQLADGFFARTARALMDLDAVTVVAVHPRYAEGEGYRAISQAVETEIWLPERVDHDLAIRAVLTKRIALAGVDAPVEAVVDPAGIGLLARAYDESVAHERAGDLRRVLAAARAAVELAATDPAAELIGPGHVQEALASLPLLPD